MRFDGAFAPVALVTPSTSWAARASAWPAPTASRGARAFPNVPHRRRGLRPGAVLLGTVPNGGTPEQHPSASPASPSAPVTGRLQAAPSPRGPSKPSSPSPSLLPRPPHFLVRLRTSSPSSDATEQVADLSSTADRRPKENHVDAKEAHCGRGLRARLQCRRSSRR